MKSLKCHIFLEDRWIPNTSLTHDPFKDFHQGLLGANQNYLPDKCLFLSIVNNTSYLVFWYYSSVLKSLDRLVSSLQRTLQRMSVILSLVVSSYFLLVTDLFVRYLRQEFFLYIFAMTSLLKCPLAIYPFSVPNLMCRPYISISKSIDDTYIMTVDNIDVDTGTSTSTNQISSREEEEALGKLVLILLIIFLAILLMSLIFTGWILLTLFFFPLLPCMTPKARRRFFNCFKFCYNACPLFACIEENAKTIQQVLPRYAEDVLDALVSKARHESRGAFKNTAKYIEKNIYKLQKFC